MAHHPRQEPVLCKSEPSPREIVRPFLTDVSLMQTKVAVNRWQDGNEGSDVLIAALFKAEDRRESTVFVVGPFERIKR